MEQELSLAILDDEIHIIRLLEALIPWQELSVRYAGFAQNGVDALSLIEKEKPDIVITDIKMPGMDGLSVIASVREKNPETQFIIISGFSQFDYAKKAIAYNVENYLLKPINKTELCATLEKLVKKRRARSEEINVIKQSCEQKRNQIFERLLKDENPLEKLFDKPPVTLCLVKTDSLEENISKEISHLLFEKTESILKKHNVEPVIFQDYGIFCFPVQLELTEAENLVTQMLFDINKISELFPDLLFTVFIGEVENLNFKKTFDFLYKSLPLRHTENRTLFLPRSLPEKKDTSALIEKVNRNCEKLFDSFNISYVEEFVEELCSDVTAFPAFQAESVFYEIAKKIAFAAENKNQKGLEWFDGFSKNLFVCRNVDSLCTRFKLKVCDFFFEYFEAQKNDLSRPIRSADKYMQEHFMDWDFSLEKVSAQVGLTSQYFSALYKKEMGLNFLEALTEIRIEKAKELLSRTNDTIAEIAGNVGYNDIKYFSKVFRKVMGIKPSEFRKLYN
ncbi:MAG: response regulator [Treponema sp.]